MTISLKDIEARSISSSRILSGSCRVTLSHQQNLTRGNNLNSIAGLLRLEFTRSAAKSHSWRTNCADVGPVGRARQASFSRRSIQDVGIISVLFVLWSRGLAGGGGKCFPCSWYFPEMKIKTQCPESNQQALRRIACTFGFQKNPHKISLTLN